jgi:hypothetical protein
MQQLPGGLQQLISSQLGQMQQHLSCNCVCVCVCVPCSHHVPQPAVAPAASHNRPAGAAGQLEAGGPHAVLPASAAACALVRVPHRPAEKRGHARGLPLALAAPRRQDQGERGVVWCGVRQRQQQQQQQQLRGAAAHSSWCCPSARDTRRPAAQRSRGSMAGLCRTMGASTAAASCARAPNRGAGAAATTDTPRSRTPCLLLPLFWHPVPGRACPPPLRCCLSWT